MKNQSYLRIVLLTTLIVGIYINSIFAQGENNNWHFGDKMAINFNTNPPLLQESNLKSIESSGAVSDASGNLLFYTMGGRVWDRNGNEMPNATGLLGNGPYGLTGVPAGSSACGVVIVPNPANASQYYLFCGNAYEEANHKLYYSLIDMTLNSGLGDVVPTVKNVVLMDSVSEYLSSTRGGDCKSYWLVARSSIDNGSKFCSFKVGQNGVSAIPVITLPPQIALGNRMQTCFASDGVTMVSSGNHLTLSKFDNLSGQITGFVSIDSVPLGAVAFSGDDNKLYITMGNGGIRQYDLSLLPNITAVASSAINPDPNFVPNTTVYYNDVRLAPNGKVYILGFSSTNSIYPFISVINNPNGAGTGCNLVGTPFSLPPSWATPGSIYTSFGSPVIVNPKADTIFHRVRDTLLCGGKNIQLRSSDDDAVIFAWSNGATTPYIDINHRGIFWVRASNNCHVTTDSFNVQYSEVHIALGHDTTICKGSLISLNAFDTSISNYYWNTGSTTAAIDVSSPGTYSVTGTDKFCTVSDTITIDVIDPYVRILENDTVICSDHPLTIHAEANPMSSFSWNNGGTENSIKITAAKTYIVTAKNQCGSFSDSVTVKTQNCDCYLFVPSAFSPNGDGLNDVFKTNLSCSAISYTIGIYNRYGQRIFSAASPNTAWEGTFNGKLLDEGTYFYYIKFKSPLGNVVERKGDVTLLR